MDIEQLKENINAFTNTIHKNLTNFRRFFSIPAEDTLTSISFSSDGINLITENHRYNQITHKRHAMSNFIRWLRDVSPEEKYLEDNTKWSCPDVKGIEWFNPQKMEGRITQLEHTVEKLKMYTNGLKIEVNKLNNSVSTFQVY